MLHIWLVDGSAGRRNNVKVAVKSATPFSQKKQQQHQKDVTIKYLSGRSTLALVYLLHRFEYNLNMFIFFLYLLKISYIFELQNFFSQL